MYIHIYGLCVLCMHVYVCAYAYTHTIYIFDTCRDRQMELLIKSSTVVTEYEIISEVWSDRWK